MSERETIPKRFDLQSHLSKPSGSYSRSPAISMRYTDKSSSASADISPRGSTSPNMRPTVNGRQPSNGLRLGPVPKYHPSVYRSPATSNTNTPTQSRPTSRGLLSPRTHTRHISDIQRQHQEYQRQMLATLRQTTGLVGIASSDTPSKPHILPHASPGPATPLNLEESGDYLSARSIGEGSPRELADKLIRVEQERRSGMRMDRSSPAVSPRC